MTNRARINLSTMKRNGVVNRRDFLTAAAGLTLVLTVVPDRPAMMGDAMAESPISPNVWLTIGADGTIEIVSPAAELGQGTFTTLAAVLADELDADWAHVKPVYPAVWDEKKFGNPEYNGV